MLRGIGEGTTRRKLSPSGLNSQPFSLASRVRVLLGVDGPDRLRRVPEGGVVAIDLDQGQQRREALVQWQLVPELLLDEVADHPLGLGAEQVERVRLDLGVGRALQRQQTDLRPVPV